MAGYDRYERGDRPRRYAQEDYYEERDRDGRYRETRENYLSVHPPSRDLVPRQRREDSDFSVEEVPRDPRDFASARDIRRARSAEPYYYDEYDRRRGHYDDRDYHHRPKKSASRLEMEEEEAKERMLGKKEKILAALGGAALLMGGKEAYDQYDAKQKDDGEVHRNLMVSAALGAAGALAGYQGAEFYEKHKSKDERKQLVRMRSDGSYGSDDEKSKSGEKNFMEKMLGATGLAATVGALAGKAGSGGSERGGDLKRSQSKSAVPSKVQDAAKAAILAGATEAFRVAKEPGGWKGEKLKRVATAAMGAGTIDAAQDSKGGKLKLAESVIGGLVGNRVIHGSKNNIEEDEKTGRSRSRSRHSRARSTDGGGGGGVSGLAALATAGLGAFGAKKAYDAYDERSRSRRRGSDSDGSPDRRRNRSRSVADTARRGLAKLGFGSAEEEDDRKRHADDYDEPPRRRASSRRRRYSDESDLDRDRPRGGGYIEDRRRNDYDDDEYDRRDRERDRSRPRKSRSAASESDLGDSSEDERRAKKMKDRPRHH